MQVFHVINEQQTLEIAQQLAKTLKAGDVIAYRGDLGAGKTTFTRGLAKGLGLTSAVSSPTFALINEYCGGPVPLYHFDLYRINDPDSLETTGYFDYLASGDGILAVEWSERASGELPDHTIFVTIKAVAGCDTARKITITGRNCDDSGN